MSTGCRAYAWLTTILFAIPAVLIIISFNTAIERISLLQSKGIHVSGQIIKMYVSSSEDRLQPDNAVKHYRIDYSFSDEPVSFSGKEHSGSTEVEPERYSNLHIGDPVPVLYDPYASKLAAIDFDGRISSGQQIISDQHARNLLLLILGGFYLLLMSILLRTYAKERKLLRYGNVVHATSIKQKINGGWRATVTDLIYQFKDNEGKVVEGTRAVLGSGSALTNFTEFAAVIYSPDDSNKNMLYPPFWAVCIGHKEIQKS